MPQLNSKSLVAQGSLLLSIIKFASFFYGNDTAGRIPAGDAQELV